jgi:small subunit ribosomal protein S5e
MTRGSREASFRSLKSISETLADEIIAASKGSASKTTSNNSYALKKKDETERVAKGNR